MSDVWKRVAARRRCNRLKQRSNLQHTKENKIVWRIWVPLWKNYKTAVVNQRRTTPKYLPVVCGIAIKAQTKPCESMAPQFDRPLPERILIKAQLYENA